MDKATQSDTGAAVALLVAAAKQLAAAGTILAAVGAKSARTEPERPSGRATAVDVAAYFQRALEMIGGDQPECRCGYCGPCIARGALAGPSPGDTWFEWAEMRAVCRERLRRQFPDLEREV